MNNGTKERREGQIFIVYSAVGNRLTDILRRSYTYNNGNELLSQNGTSFSFDGNGNMIVKIDSTGTTRYTYNTENQLIRVELPDGKVAEYKYDPFGRRIQKSITDTNNNITITKYVYDREDILFELDGNNNIVAEYLHGPGIDEPIAMIRGGQTYYYHADGLGSIIAITDSSGNVVQRYEYDSFGNITYQQDANFKQFYTYTGREYDPETELYYYRARYYDAKIGRFLQQDPILSPINPVSVGLSQRINKNIWLLPYFTGNPKALQPYLYSGANPINFTDPYGLHTYVPVRTTPDGGTIYGVFDDNGNYTGTVTGDRPPIYDVAEDIGVCYLNTMDKIAGLSESMPVHPSGKPYPGFFRDLWNSLLPLRRFYGLP